MPSRLTRQIIITLIGSSILLVGGCCATASSGQPEKSQTSLTSEQIRESFRSEIARRQFVQDMMDEAYRLPDPAQKAAAVVVAGDRATEEVGKTSRAINMAIDITIENVRNAGTIGYKAVSARISDGAVPTLSLDLTTGSMHATTYPLDLGIEGDGFFAVKDRKSADRFFFTRCGTLSVTSSGELVVNIGDGYQLVPRIMVPTNATEISVGLDGTVQYIKAGATTKSTAGQIMLANFPNPRALKGVPGSLYAETADSGPPVMSVPGNNGTGQILSGFFESSNVDLLTERMRLRFLCEWRDTLKHAIDAHQP